MADFPWYRCTENSPPVSNGISIYTPSVVKIGSPATFPLYGSFSIPAALAAELECHVMQAVVILIRGPYPAIKNVGSGELLFPDDVTRSGETITGFFNLNLFDFFNLMVVPNHYWVSASLFHHQSDIFSVDVV